MNQARKCGVTEPVQENTCTIGSIVSAPANVMVDSGALLTIPSGMKMNIDFTHYHLLVKSGGGVSNIAFLQGTGDGPNAQSARVDATFFIEKIKKKDGSISFQLQYSQMVLLNFNGLS